MDTAHHPEPNGTPMAITVARWYATHSAVRRLWAVEDAGGVRIIVKLEPTLDGDDIYPAWIANSHEWAHELQSRIGSPVTLQLMDELAFEAIELGAGSAIIADVYWRDPGIW
jgi:hypothetical protein